jgi:hypothetical protein
VNWDHAGVLTDTDACRAIVAGTVVATLMWPVSATFMYRVRDLGTSSDMWAPLALKEEVAISEENVWGQETPASLGTFSMSKRNPTERAAGNPLQEPLLADDVSQNEIC